MVNHPLLPTTAEEKCYQGRVRQNIHLGTRVRMHKVCYRGVLDDKQGKLGRYINLALDYLHVDKGKLSAVVSL